MLSTIPVGDLLWIFTFPCSGVLVALWHLTKRNAREGDSWQFYRMALLTCATIALILFWVIAARLAGPTAWNEEAA